MRIKSHPFLSLTAGAIALAGCSSVDLNSDSRAKDGAIIGGALGAFLGANRRGGGTTVENAAAGAIIGAAVGGVIGDQLDKQARRLREEMGNEGVGIVNTGSELIVTLPEDITFASGSDAIRPSLRADLRVLANHLNEFPESTVDVIGHTDNIGPASSNQELSARRAETVAQVLLQAGVAQSRIRSFGRGENEPAASNLSDEGRAQNRRVEIVIRPVT